jgi:hypothetical protein
MDIVTANRLSDGRVVYLTDAFGWSFDLSRARVFADGDALTRALAQARAAEGTVCDPYAVEVTVGAHGPAVASARERLRAEGPEAVLARFGYLDCPGSFEGIPLAAE